MIKWKNGLNVMHLLKDCGYSSRKILDENLIGQASVQKMRTGKMVGIITLDRICRLTGMQPGDLIEYVVEPGQKNGEE